MFPFFSRVLQPKSNWEQNVCKFFLFYFIYLFIFLKAGREVLLFFMEESKGDELKRIIMIKRIKINKINKMMKVHSTTPEAKFTVSLQTASKSLVF